MGALDYLEVRFVSSADALASYIHNQHECLQKVRPQQIDNVSFTAVNVSHSVAEIRTYDILQDGSVNNNYIDVITIGCDTFRALAQCLRSFIVESFSHEYSTMYIATKQYQQPDFQQSLQQELLEVGNGTLKHLTCGVAETVCSPYSYGYTTIEPFKRNEHSKRMSICLNADNNDETAIWLFKTLMKKGQPLSYSTIIEWQEQATFYTSRNKIFKHQSFLFRSTSDKPKYINEKGCEVAATIEINPPPEGWPDEVEFHYKLTVSVNGPLIEVNDLLSKKQFKANLVESTFKSDFIFLGHPCLAGALFFGLSPFNIKRRSRFTYVFGFNPVFQRMGDQGHIKYHVPDKRVRRIVFYKMIEEDESLCNRIVFTWRSNAIDREWIALQTISLFRSPLKEPVSIENPADQFEEVARIWTILPSGVCRLKARRPDAMQWEVQLIVDDTHLVFKVIHIETGQESVKYVEF